MIVNCPACDGSGYCAWCAGVGQLLDRRDQYVRCPECSGEGQCRACDGYGDHPDALHPAQIAELDLR
jgi:DnaJ-class molecular chaperone